MSVVARAGVGKRFTAVAVVIALNFLLMKKLYKTLVGKVGGWVLSLWLGAAAGGWAQTAPAWTTAAANQSSQASSASVTTGTAIDASGNVFVTGYFSGQVTFGTTTLTSAGNSDLFVAKWVPTHATWAWAQSGGGIGGDAGYGIAVAGNRVYVTGCLLNNSTNYDNVQLGGTSPGTSTTVQYGVHAFPSTDLLLAAYTDNGSSATLAWTQVGGGTDTDAGYGVAVNGTSIYVGGYLTNDLANSRNVLLGGSGTLPGTAPQYGATALPSTDILLLKYTDNGSSATLRWSQIGGGTTADFGQGVAVSGDNVYVTGYMGNNVANINAVVFGGTGTAPGTATQLGAGRADQGTSSELVLAKYIDNGNTAALGWTQVAGGFGPDMGFGVAATGSSVYVVGTISNDRFDSYGVRFGGSGTMFGTAPQLGTSLYGNTANNYYDIALAKYTDNGATATLRWTQAAGGTWQDWGRGVAVSGSSVYITGYITNDVTDWRQVLFGSDGAVVGTRSQPGVSTTIGEDLVVARYTDNGNTATIDWTQIGGGNGQDWGNSIAAAGPQVVVGGYCKPTATFGNFELSGVSQSLAMVGQLGGTPLAVGVAQASIGSLHLYPNPTTGRTRLEGVVPDTPVQVISLLGQVVISTLAGKNGVTLELPPGLATGMYVVRAGGQSSCLAVE